MRSVDPSLCVSRTQISDPSVHIPKRCSSPDFRALSGVPSVTPAVLYIKDADLRVTSGRKKNPIARVRHEFDGEDVGGMAGSQSCFKRKGRSGRFRLVRVDIDMLVIATRS